MLQCLLNGQRQHRALSCKLIFMQKQLSGYKEIHGNEALMYEEELSLDKNFKVQSNLPNNPILGEDYTTLTNVGEPLVYGEVMEVKDRTKQILVMKSKVELTWKI